MKQAGTRPKRQKQVSFEPPSMGGGGGARELRDATHRRERCGGDSGRTSEPPRHGRALRHPENDPQRKAPPQCCALRAQSLPKKRDLCFHTHEVMSLSTERPKDAERGHSNLRPSPNLHPQPEPIDASSTRLGPRQATRAPMSTEGKAWQRPSHVLQGAHALRLRPDNVLRNKSYVDGVTQ